ncbi:ROK family protein [Actinopolymorpha sp. NPDC004070]|uniref:ROK family protein n=1 Tax=Actinopolymorpha sp. NPDC004070 TaxID=3154548 RepID=UPI0033B00673
MAKKTELARQTVVAALEDLMHRGLAEQLAPTEGQAGRPAKRYRFRAHAGHVLGLDIAPDHAIALVTDLDGHIVAEECAAIGEKVPAADRLAFVERLSRSAVGARPAVWAAAAGTSGVVDRSGRVVVSNLIPGWTGLDLGNRIGEWFGCVGLAANDANLAAVAEHWKGSARHVQDAIYILTGYRAGHGLLLGGRAHAGRSGAAGELGKLPAIGRDDPSFVLSQVGRSAREIFAAAASGDTDALVLVDELARGLARGASVLVMAVDPELLVLGGEFFESGNQLLDPFRHYLSEMCLLTPEVTSSTLGRRCVALGAARIALDRLESSPRLLGPGDGA